MISRTTLGKIFSDDFARADGAPGNGWTAHLGTWALESGALKATDSLFGYMTLEQPLGASYNEMVTQVRWKRSSNFTRPGIFSKQDFPSKHGYSAEWGAIHADGVQTQYENGGDPVQIAEITGVAFAFGTYYQSKLHTLNGHQRLWIEGVLKLNNTSTQWDGTSYSSTGVLRGDGGDSTAVYYKDFCAYANNAVVISGLGSGYKVRVGGKTATESGSGTATLDLAELTMPQTTIDVLDPSNVVVDTLNPSSGGVWGGDVYTYAETAPTAPGAFTHPLSGETFDASLTVAFGAATDPEGDTLHYRGEYSTDNGGSWSTLFALQLGLSYVWDTSLIADGVTNKVRVLAYDGVLEGPWLTSSAFAIYHNQAPSAPASFVHPLSGETFDASLPAEWTAATDPEAQAVEYYGEISNDNGSTWSEAFDWQSGLTNTIDTSGIAYGIINKLRVKARDSLGAVGAWLTSAAFSIVHSSSPPAAPTVEVLIRGDYSVLLGISGFVDSDMGTPGTYRATRIVLDLESGDYLTPKYDSDWYVPAGWDTTSQLKVWLTGLPQNTDLKVEVAHQDEGGEAGLYGQVHFTTRRLHVLGDADGWDQDRNEGEDQTIQPVYGELVAGVGFVPSRYPELALSLELSDGLVNDNAIRLRMANALADYSQAGIPTSASQVVKYVGAPLSAYEDGPFWFMLVIRPELVLDLPWQDVLQGAYEIFGSDGDHWWLYQRDGALGIGPPVDATITPHENDHPIGNGPNFYFGDIVADQPYLILFTFLREVADPSCLSIVGSPHAGRVTTPGIACSWLNGVRRAHGHLRGDGDFPSSGGSCSPGEDQYLPTAPTFTTRDDTLWLGRHSGDGDRNFDQSANGIPMCGAISEFAFGGGRLLADSEADALFDAFNDGDMDAFAKRIKLLRPDVYDRFQQPLPPLQPTLSAG